MASSPSLLTSTTTSKLTTPPPLLSSLPSKTVNRVTTTNNALTSSRITRRRELMSTLSLTAAGTLIMSSSCLVPPALAALEEEYAKETAEVISKVRSTINMAKTDPNIAEAVAELREASNTWVAKYRREKTLLGRPSFRDMYSALNAVSGHYVSFGPTATIPAKRKTRILEEMDTAEKALLKGR
ncbi:photosystem II repair protein PSB27-H1, chloroplastic [Typha latifolia]|uniref:photosystem II repair protein PSB27-H1, chloroplastic n=1 Tax=Typha latifolia TaxID=4733 RepID=UPI003C2BC909